MRPSPLDVVVGTVTGLAASDVRLCSDSPRSDAPYRVRSVPSARATKPMGCERSASDSEGWYSGMSHHPHEALGEDVPRLTSQIGCRFFQLSTWIKPVRYKSLIAVVNQPQRPLFVSLGKGLKDSPCLVRSINAELSSAQDLHTWGLPPCVKGHAALNFIVLAWRKFGYLRIFLKNGRRHALSIADRVRVNDLAIDTSNASRLKRL